MKLVVSTWTADLEYIDLDSRVLMEELERKIGERTDYQIAGSISPIVCGEVKQALALQAQGTSHPFIRYPNVTCFSRLSTFQFRTKKFYT